MATKGDYKTCIKCMKNRVTKVHFYSSDSSMFSDGRVPICKTCIKSDIDENDINSVKKVLRQIDKPFIYSEWNTAKDSEKETFGSYLRIISSLPQYKGLTYEDSSDSYSASSNINYNDYEDNNQIVDEEIPLVISPEVRLKWGAEFSTFEYFKLEKFWDEMTTSNNIETPQHKRQLELYCKINIFIDRAFKDQDFKTFEMLNKQLTNIIKDAGFRPIDKVSGNESAGIRSFSQIFEEVEKEGFITPVPYNGADQDIVDRTIMYLLNYQRRLLNMETLIEPPDDTPKINEEGDF